uniref:CCHC-type domain-containing protein n=1 Tax=viral metagenome TaxID=1070528 RepID=A0A6C0HIW5_9ZZZZ
MSARNFSNNKSTSTTGAHVPRAPCCKVCKDAGEPENVYSSHYVKDREGNISCPKLKAIVCLNCGKRGHTSSYCKAPIAAKMREDSKKAAAPAKSTKVAPETKNRFDCLLEDDSDDDKLLARKHARPKPAASVKMPAIKQIEKKALDVAPINVSNVFDFPALSADTKTSAASAVASEPKAFSYANMAAKPMELKPVRRVIDVPSRQVRPASPTTVPPPPRFYGKASEIDWTATYESSSDEDDYDYDDEDF